MLCVTTVKGAQSWDEAITKALILSQNQLAKASKSGNPACKKYYKDTKENLKESLEAMGIAAGSEEVKNKSLNVQLPAALTNLEDCIKALKGLKEYTSAEKTLMHGVEQAIRVCLAVNESKSASKSPMSYTPSFNIIS
ncbi:PREDICTED: uncharacterized protein LOC109179521 isoform X2 [Ipomoea nil]|uniref:uncharacterized protein LOC109179521 isoform X2 n=1 Tax=Ipomoea nil TaxID=35883 RepID=UPI0009011B21|nr:PREDICTED: uncharacterized protein LOC109179521 isoform X2 [Ipomoea nil]